MGAIEPDVDDIPLRPNNSMTLESYVPEHGKYGRGHSLAAVETHFTESTELALGIIEQGLPLRRIRALTTAAMIVTSLVRAENIGQLAAALENSKDVWTSVTGPQRSELDERVDRSYLKNRNAMHTLIRALWERQAPVGDKFLAGWMNSMDRLLPSLSNVECTLDFREPTPADSERRYLTHLAHPTWTRSSIAMETVRTSYAIASDCRSRTNGFFEA